MQAHDLDAPNLDTVLNEPRGRSGELLDALEAALQSADPDKRFLEDDPPRSVEYDPPISVMQSDTKQISGASAIFLFLFMVLIGIGGALAWRYYGGQATNEPTAPPQGFAELQQQLKSVAADLSAVKHTLEQQSAANYDQLTRIQEQISQQSFALLSSSPLVDKPVSTPLAKPAQHPAHVSTQDPSKPIQVGPPQSQLPPKR